MALTREDLRFRPTWFKRGANSGRIDPSLPLIGQDQRGCCPNLIVIGLSKDVPLSQLIIVSRPRTYLDIILSDAV